MRWIGEEIEKTVKKHEIKMASQESKLIDQIAIGRINEEIIYENRE